MELADQFWVIVHGPKGPSLHDTAPTSDAAWAVLRARLAHCAETGKPTYVYRVVDVRALGFVIAPAPFEGAMGYALNGTAMEGGDVGPRVLQSIEANLP